MLAEAISGPEDLDDLSGHVTESITTSGLRVPRRFYQGVELEPRQKHRADADCDTFKFKR